jgi:hypothetical protein
MQHTTEAPKQYQCRHIFTDGHRCASPCLRQEEFCYYHHTTRKPIANPKQRSSRRCSSFHLPLPEDRSAIQASIGEVLQRIASNDIDPRRAGLLLYGLQIASLNLPKPQTLTKPELQTVEEITIDPALGVLAPRTDISETARPKSAVALLIERMLQSKEDPDPTKDAMDKLPQIPEPATIPTLQATADNLPNTPKSNPTAVTSSRAKRQTLRAEQSARPLSFRPKRSEVEKSASLPHLSTAPSLCRCLFFPHSAQTTSFRPKRSARPLSFRPERSEVEKSASPPHLSKTSHRAGAYSWLLYPIPASTPRIYEKLAIAPGIGSSP